LISQQELWHAMMACFYHITIFCKRYEIIIKFLPLEDDSHNYEDFRNLSIYDSIITLPNATQDRGKNI
jgi:hypothetical protein